MHVFRHICQKVNTCNWTPKQVISLIQKQMRHIRNSFDARSTIDYLEIHFITDARAFVSHPSRHTSRIFLSYKNGEIHYRPF